MLLMNGSRELASSSQLSGLARIPSILHKNRVRVNPPLMNQDLFTS
jgi:hypothetical protein